MENGKILELKRRREIYEFISQNSGLHMRDISRKMDIPFTSLKYHLRYLENRELIISRKDSKYNRYFISLKVGETEKKILACFRKRTALHIILFLILVIQCSQKEISQFLEKHPATISFHLRNMLRAGIIEQVPIQEGHIKKETRPSLIKRSQKSSEKIYVLKDHWYIYELLIKHKDYLSDKNIVMGMIEHVEYFIAGGIPIQVQNREDTLRSVVNTTHGFFLPPSFCS